MTADYAGNPAHPEHDAFLQELGAVAYAAAGLSGIIVDLLRVHHGIEFFEMMRDDLGSLIKRLAVVIPTSGVPGLESFVARADAARVTRNDVLHALPVAHGLHRRTKADRGRVVNFFTVEELRAARQQLETVRAEGGRLLYFDGGLAVRAMYA